MAGDHVLVRLENDELQARADLNKAMAARGARKAQQAEAEAAHREALYRLADLDIEAP